MAANEQQHMEMPPGFPELWEGVTRARMDIAELKGMVKMHFSDSSHHTPPCSTASATIRPMRPFAPLMMIFMGTSVKPVCFRSARGPA